MRHSVLCSGSPGSRALASRRSPIWSKRGSMPGACILCCWTATMSVTGLTRILVLRRWIASRTSVASAKWPSSCRVFPLWMANKQPNGLICGFHSVCCLVDTRELHVRAPWRSWAHAAQDRFLCRVDAQFALFACDSHILSLACSRCRSPGLCVRQQVPWILTAPNASAAPGAVFLFWADQYCGGMRNGWTAHARYWSNWLARSAGAVGAYGNGS